MNTDAKLLDKIQKLLTLAAGEANVSESEQAAAKARELITKYNVDQSRLRPSEHTVEATMIVSQNYYITGRYTQWQRDLFHQLRKFYFVSTLLGYVSGIERNELGRLVKSTDKKRGYNEVEVIGRKTDVTMFITLISSLINQFRNAADNDLAALKSANALLVNAGTWRNSFYKGCVRGITAKLESEWRAQNETDENLRALVVVTDKAIRQWTSNKYPRLGKMQSSQSVTSRSAYDSGYATGRNSSGNLLLE